MDYLFDLPISFLQLFGSGGGEGLGSGVTAEAAAPQAVSGVNPENAPGAPDAGVREGDFDREFERLIQGDYKQAYQKKVQQIIQKRLKDAKDTEKRFGEVAPVLERLAKRFGVDPGDLEGLERAASNDGAGSGGQVSGAEASGASETEARDAFVRDYSARQQVAQWLRQAEEAKAGYPGLDFQKEFSDPDFRYLLEAGVDVGSAYLVRHKEQIIPALLSYTARSVEKRLGEKIRSQGLRPAENGLRPQGAALTRPDVRKLTKADREDIRRRAAKGERIAL